MISTTKLHKMSGAVDKTKDIITDDKDKAISFLKNIYLNLIIDCLIDNAIDSQNRTLHP